MQSNGLHPAPAPVAQSVEHPDHASKQAIEKSLLSDGPISFYRPSLPIMAFTYGDHNLPPLSRFYQDLPAMLAHERVSQAMTIWKAGIANAEFEIEASSPAVAAFVESEISRFWELSLDQVQKGDEWGWAGCQVFYTIEDGLMHTTHLEAFESRDVKPLVSRENGQYVGMRVRSAGNWGADGGASDLYGPGFSPPKAFWYTHQKHRGLFVGRAQPFEAWRPWSRLAARDGAEEIIDAAVYRYGYRGDLVRFPPEDIEAKRQTDGKTGRQSNFDKAMELGEGIKAGSPIGLSSVTYPNTEIYKWDIERDGYVLDVDPLLNYELALNKKIDAGIGVPSEIIEAADTGSGYSGRAIPLEGYYQGQQTVATAKVQQWKHQIGDPLVGWNFGRHAWFRITVKPLLETRRKSAAAGQPANPGGPPAPGTPAPQQQPPEDPPARHDDSERKHLATREPTGADMPAGSGELPKPEPIVAAAEHVEADLIAREAAMMLARINAETRSEILKAVGKGTLPEQIEAVRLILDRHRFAFARFLTGARIAALLTAMRRIAERTPLLPSPGTSDAIDELLADAIGARNEAQWGPSLETIPEDRRERVRNILEARSAAVAAGASPPDDGSRWTVAGYDSDEPQPDIEFPLIDAAVADLRSRRLLTRDQFDSIAADARQEAFTVAGVESEATLEKIRDTLADLLEEGPTLREFKSRVEEAVGTQPFLSDAHAETVYRTNTIAAYSNGQDEVLNHPMVADLFPYRAIFPTHDGRTRPWHLALERSGIDGTNIYNANDPVWRKIRPPSDYNCRCLGSPCTIAQAAEAGVREAIEWRRTGKPPESPTFVSLPADWEQSTTFVRLAFDPGEKRDNSGKWTADTQLTLFATAKSGKGQWITIGGSKGADGKRHGGSPVYIEGGRITKGHPSLTGKPIAALSVQADEGKSDPDTSPEHTHRQQLNQSKSYARAKFAKEARKEGLNPAALHQLAAEIMAHDKEFKAHKLAMLRDVRKQMGGKGKTITQHLRSGAVEDDIRLDNSGQSAAGKNTLSGFDEIADKAFQDFPFLFHGGTDKPDDQLREMLAEGNPEPMSEEDAYGQAMEQLQYHKAGETEPEPETDVSSPHVKIADKGQISLKAPGNAKEANALLDHMDALHSAAESEADAAKELPDIPANKERKVRAALYLHHVARQWLRARKLAAPFASKSDEPIPFATDAPDALTLIRSAASDVQPEPSAEQKEAGNYRKGHLTWNGLPITIETAKGQTRRGDGWETVMQDHYGYIKRTESEADGDHVDVFLSEDHLDSEIVFVVNQQNKDGAFDEHKCVLGQTNEAGARAAYLRNYSAGWKCGPIAPMTLAAFKAWLDSGDTSKAVVE